VQNAEPTGLARLEDELRTALSWEPSSSAAARMDRAVSVAVAETPAIRSRPVWHWRLSRSFVVLAASLLLLGAASALTLLQQAAELMPGWRIAYERAERLDLSQTLGDYTVTLERGYADPHQLVLAFLVRGPLGESLAVARSNVTDAQGRSYLDIAGGDIGAEIENSAATISSYQVPPNVGSEVELTATVPELIPVAKGAAVPVGPWVFHFHLPVHPAVVVEPKQSVMTAGVPIALSRVQITATAVRIQLDLDLAAVRNAQWSRWSLEGTLRHNSEASQDLQWAPLPPEWTGQPKDQTAAMIDRAEQGSVMVRQTFAGVDAPRGRWTLTIRRLTGADGTGNVRFVDGPWVLIFDVP
jgi:hypothetical protein